MAANLPTIKPFDAGANPAEAWRFWRQDFEDYIEALKYSQESETTKTALFRHVCGEELKNQYRSFTLVPLAPATEVTLRQILDEFDTLFSAYQNEIYAAFIFLELKQKTGERFQDFYSRLRLAIEDCNYGASSDRMLRDKIVQGIQDKPLQERLLRETSTRAKTLQAVVSECKAAEQSKAQSHAMNETKMAVNALAQGNRKLNQPRKKFVHQTDRIQYRPTLPTYSKENKGMNHKQSPCRCCGRLHEPRNCPAYGTVCKTCGFKNHWASHCRTKLGERKNQNGQRLHVLDQMCEDDSLQGSTMYLGELTTNIHAMKSSNSEREWYQDLYVNGHKIPFKLDTGSQVNVIPEQELLKWEKKPIVRRTTQQVFDYSGQEVPIIGECTLSCETNTVSNNLRFIVTRLNSSPILSLEACKILGLIKRVYQLRSQQLDGSLQSTEQDPTAKVETPEQILKEFEDVFTGMGRLNRVVKIQLKPDAIPQVSAPRKIPLALHDRVKTELQRMVNEGIIAKVDKPTEWVSNMVVVDTPKKLRICIDPRPLNDAIQRPHYQIPTTEKLFTSLQGCTIFTMLDAKDGFWQLPLEESSSYLTTFTTPWGRYRFKVLPFGLNNAPEEFQRAMNELFEDEPQVNPYFDDVALGSETTAEHCKLLRRTLAIARRENLKFNKDKVQLAKSTITYLGHVISAQGIEPDPKKVEAINGFATPKCPEDLHRFLGMVTYQSKFTPHLSNITHSLRQLLRKDIAWLWDENAQRDFDLIKATLMKAPCLRIFDTRKPVTLSVDASQFGLGAVILQDNVPIAYGSASLTETQKRYAQIEKELLAVIYGLEHFNYYTYGRIVEVQTDHKPLLGLSKKPYDAISPRLQRMLLRMNRYNVTLTYIPGKQLVVADALSRAQLPHVCTDIPRDDITFNICLITEASPSKWRELQKSTINDPTLQDVLFHVRNGWPDTKARSIKTAQPYWHCRDELYETDEGILCRGQRLIVPEANRSDVLKTLHMAHRGIVACKAKAREYFYWPSMNQDVENYIGNCKICQQHQRNNQHEPLVDRDLPTRPWQKVACDFFELQGKHYLLMIDYFSKYIEIQHMHGTTASSVIATMKAIYARHGIPEELVSDQGPPFTSEAMRMFHEDWNIKHNTTSPYYPRSNGQVERAVQTLKHTLQKAAEDGKDLHMVLLDYRITPTTGLPSPAELLMGRRLRSFLPSHPDRLCPNFDIQMATNELAHRQENQKKYGNQHAKPLPVLQEKASVWFRRRMNENWKHGTVIKIGPEPRTYAIRSDDGAIYTRNRFYIRPDTSTGPPVAEPQQWNSRTVEDLYPIQPSRRAEAPAAEQVELPSGKARQLTASRVEPVRVVVQDQHRLTTRSGRTVSIPTRYRQEAKD